MAQSSEPSETLRYGRYEIPVDRNGEPVELGRGGMGITYKALDTKLDRIVVLKVVSGALHHNQQARQKFLREARLLARLSHPNIAAVHDIGEQSGTDYYVMEYIEGEDLGSRVHAMGPIPVGLSVEIARQAAAALASAWKQGLIHRDIKPANLMLAKTDGSVKVKLIDFGLAKVVGAGAVDITRITMTGETAGYSPAFASPEQIEGMDVDTRSDIYSLGVTLWYLLAGKPPFSGTSRRQVENAHINQPPPAHLLHGTVPKPVVDLLQRMLKKDPQDRPENPEILERELTVLATSDIVKSAYDTLAFGPTIGTRPAPTATTRPRAFNPLFVAVPGLAVLGLALAIFFLRSSPPKPPIPVAGPTPASDPVAAATPESAAPATPPPAAVKATFENGLGMKFVPVPGTKVLFSMYETRVADYEAFVKANPTYDAGPGWSDPYFPQTPQHPVVFVSWNDAVKFCEWLTTKERADGRILPAQSYRLPTDDEWSAAVGLPREPGDSPDARDGKNKTHYPWHGEKWPPSSAGRAGKYAKSLKIAGDTSEFTQPVGGFEANANGLHDMGGNAWEWVQDWYESAKSGRQTNKTLRGASWLDSQPGQLLSSSRLFETPETRLNAFGFRVVLTSQYAR